MSLSTDRGRATSADAARPARLSWGVCATVHESPDLLAAFAAHHAALGAAEVWLFLDRPNAPAQALLRHIPEVRVILCDAAHWARTKSGVRPKSREIRQKKNAQMAYRETSVDRLLHIDADEFLVAGKRVSEVLEAARDGVSWQVPNVERVFRSTQPPATIFDGTFRRPVGGRRRRAARLFPDIADFTTRGFTGHVVGKSFVKTGLPDVAMGIHSHRILAERDAPHPAQAALGDAYLLHFEGLTPTHWVNKLLRYAGEHGRQLNPETNFGRLVAHMHEIGADADAARALHDRLKMLSPEAEGQLRDLNLLFDMTFDPTPALARYGLRDVVDLSVGAMDAWQAQALRGT